ncbi:NAD(P)-binding protein [Leucogyrophana mollusca]|uniref:NAD(P)-binding protein n=1 Tax=Leucogyrophana mollusca TaxID=85980 RepID=A0ACB8BRT9_9AGAM|nr:NAD(P)-binding protein [Leucogyrophana mollusca]
MSVILWVLRELFPPATQFTVDDIPDMSGKVVLVTGASAGIGKETARVLLTKNAKVWVAARDQSKGEATLRELKERTGKEAYLLKLNLANLKSVKEAAAEFLSKETRLDVLFNNAGVATPPNDLLTDDGYDLQFGTNVLGHFYITKLLTPLLLATGKSSPDGIARVVNTSSNAHWFSGLHFDTFKDGPARRKMSGWTLYGQSKTGNIVFSAELARRLGDQGLVSTSLNPGGIKSELQRHSGIFAQMLASIFLYDVSFGALTQLYAGTTSDGATLNGKYLVPWARIGDPREDTQDPQLGKELWTWLEEQVESV